MTLPAADKPAVLAARLAPEPPRLEPIAIIAAPSASALQDVPGTLVAVSVAGETGVGRNASPGGDGAAPDGLGPGHGRRDGVGTGDGPGSGVIAPRLLAQVRPRYTADAMRARIQGIAALEAVVLPDGTVGDVRIVRTLDRTFGLDQEAIAAVKQWRFVPGTRSGRPIPVIVSVELTFTLR